MLLYTKNSPGCAPRILGLTVLTISIMLAWSLEPAMAQNNRSIKVMTQNMDAGTDLGFILEMADLVQAAQLTYQEITTQSRIPARAQQLAAEIASAEPDVISLQEVTIWSLYSSTGIKVLYDQLDLLMDALAAHGAHYEVVATQPLTRAGAPLDYDETQFLLYNDSDVILARTDEKCSGLHLSNVTMDRYTNLFAAGQFTELLGWISVDVEIHGKMVRYFNTHLTSSYPEMIPIQVAQGTELISVLNASPYPVILAGDFNSDASPLGKGPDLTPTAGNISAAGYTDVWQKLRLPPDYGLTWPRYLEDINPVSASQEPATPTERIDLIFEKGLTPLNIKLIFGTNAPLASDHMGVMATLQFGK